LAIHQRLLLLQQTFIMKVLCEETSKTGRLLKDTDR